MRLSFQSQYKSIGELPISELPSLTVITGENGAGKTHFLQAIQEGRILVEGIEQHRIHYHDWTSLAPQNETLDFRVVEDERNNIWRSVAQELDNIGSRVLGRINSVAAFQNLRMNLSQIAAAVSLQHDERISTEDKPELDRILSSFSSQMMGHFGQGSPQYRVLESIQQRTGIYPIGLTEKTFFENYPLTTQQVNPLQASVARLFAAYSRARELNDIAELRAKRGVATEFLTEDEFLKRFGPPPWDVVNRIFQESKLGLRINSPPDDSSRGYSTRLYHESAGVEIAFSDLSSGERILVSVALFLFFSQDDRQPTIMPDLILLDEVDAPLHPSMVLSLLRTIENVIVGEYGRKVIMATHSPSTVALAPEESVYLMDASTRKLRMVSRDAAMKSLTVGVPVLSINWENRRQVFVESKHDAIFYERIANIAQSHTIPGISLSFIESGHSTDGGCDRVRTLVTELVRAGSKTVFGIVDWDLKNERRGNVLVLGQGKRYSIENYILDPILVAALLLRDKLIARQTVELTDNETYVDLRSCDSARLQKVANATLTLCGLKLEQEKDWQVCSYANGAAVELPQSFLNRNGHSLEELLKEKFEGLRKYHKEDQLKREILDKILDDLPGLLPADFVGILRAIQGGGE